MSTPIRTAPPPFDGAPLPVIPLTAPSADGDNRPVSSFASARRSDPPKGLTNPSIGPPTARRPRQGCPSHRPEGWASKSRTQSIAP